jgi:hypothetical protein
MYSIVCTYSTVGEWKPDVLASDEQNAAVIRTTVSRPHALLALATSFIACPYRFITTAGPLDTTSRSVRGSKDNRRGVSLLERERVKVQCKQHERTSQRSIYTNSMQDGF